MCYDCNKKTQRLNSHDGILLCEYCESKPSNTSKSMKCEECNERIRIAHIVDDKKVCHQCKNKTTSTRRSCDKCGLFQLDLISVFKGKKLTKICASCYSGKERCALCFSVFSNPLRLGCEFYHEGEMQWCCYRCQNSRSRNDYDDYRFVGQTFHGHMFQNYKRIPRICTVTFEEIDE